MSEIDVIATALNELAEDDVNRAEAIYILDALRSAGFVILKKSELKHLPVEWQDFLGVVQ